MANEVIVFPDVEGLVLANLNTFYAATTGVTAVKAALMVPKTIPSSGEFVKVYRVGGSVNNLVIERATLLVEAYAKTTVRAYRIVSLTVARLLALDVISGVSIYDPQVFSGPGNLPDPSQPNLYRYTATVSLGVRGAAL